MGSISSGVGLVSGINSAQLIEQLLALESGTKTTLQARVASLTGKRTALLDVNARLLNLKGAAAKFRTAKVFKSACIPAPPPLSEPATVKAMRSWGRVDIAEAYQTSNCDGNPMRSACSWRAS